MAPLSVSTVCPSPVRPGALAFHRVTSGPAISPPGRTAVLSLSQGPSHSLSPPLLSAHTVPAGHTRHVASARALRSPPTGGEKRTLAQPRGHPRRRAAPENEQRQTSLPARPCTLQTPDNYSARQRTPEHSSALSCTLRAPARSELTSAAPPSTKLKRPPTTHLIRNDWQTSQTQTPSRATWVKQTGGRGERELQCARRCLMCSGDRLAVPISPVAGLSPFRRRCVSAGLSPFRRRSESGLSSPLRACLPPAPVPVS